MRKHRTVKFVAALIFLAALFYCLVSLAAAGWMARGGPGAGWGPGWRGWILIPVLVSGCFGAIGLLVFGAVLFFLTKIENNLAQAARGRAVAPKPVSVQPPALEPLVEPVSVPPPVETPPDIVEPIVVAGTTGLAVAAEQPYEQAEPPIEIEAAPSQPVVELESGVQIPAPAPVPEPPQVGPVPAEVELPPPAVKVVPVSAPLAVEAPAAEIEAGVQGPQIAVEPVVEAIAPAVIASQPEFHFPSVEIFESEPEEAAPEVRRVPAIEIAEPRIEAAVPAAEVRRVPAIEIAAPQIEAALPEVALPQVEVAAPQLEAALPEVALPQVEVAASQLEAALPEVALPQVEIAALKLEAALPEVALPQVELAAPQIEATWPEVRRVPAIEIAEPKIEAVVPEIETRRVPAIESAPDEVTALRAQLAALQARLVELEAQPAAVGVVPVSPEKLAAELPVKLPAAPDAARQTLATSGRLPGVEEAARIAAEMAALKPTARHEAAAPTVLVPADDLLIIKGIGPTYVRRLAEKGITTFAALAAASDELLDEVTIGLPGRAAREDWRGQARQLAG